MLLARLIHAVSHSRGYLMIKFVEAGDGESSDLSVYDLNLDEDDEQARERDLLWLLWILWLSCPEIREWRW